MKIKSSKILRAGVAVFLAGSLCGCSVKFGTHSEPKPDKVVAWATGGEDIDDLEITYEEFSKEYKFLLANSGITDDTKESIAATCKQKRSDIINSLIIQKIYAHIAKEKGVSEFTEEEEKEIDEEHEKTVESFIKQLGERAEQELEESIAAAESDTSDTAAESDASDTDGDSDTADSAGEASDATSETSTPTMTDEEKREAGSKKLDEILEAAGMTRNDMREWEVTAKLVEKVQDAIHNSIDRADAEKKFEELKKEGEEYYNSEISKYEQGGYSSVWLPEGSRLIKHVLLAFDSETQTEIQSLRSEEKDDEADKLRTEKAETLKSKQEEVEKKLDDGTNIDELIKKYSADANGSASYPDGYTVIPNGTTYMAEFQEAAFVPKKIGERTVCVTDYGVHIMVYAGDAKISDDDVEYAVNALYANLGEEELDKIFTERIEEYSFELDYDALRLDKPAEESSAVSE